MIAKFLLITLIISSLLLSKEKEKSYKHFFNVDLLNAGGGSMYGGEINLLSVAYRTSFPGIGIKINAIENNIVNKSSVYKSYAVPYLLIPLRAHNNTLNSNIIDGEVEFYFGGQVLNSVDGYSTDDKIFYLNGGISITKLFDVFDLTSLSLKLGYKSLFTDRISQSTQINNVGYGFIVFNTHLFKVSSNRNNSVKKQLKNISIDFSVSQQFYQKFIIINGKYLDPSSTTIYNVSITREINQKLDFFVNYSNLGSIDEPNIQSTGNSLSFGTSYNIINLKNGFSLPIKPAIGIMMLNHTTYQTDNLSYKMGLKISPLLTASINPEYTINFNKFNLSIFALSQINGSIVLQENIYDENISYRMFGYNFGGGVKLGF